VVEESSASVGMDYRLTLPVGCGPVSEMCVQGWAGAAMFVVRRLVMITELNNRDEPVPVQHGHVVVGVGRRVPAQKVIVVDADLVGRVMVTDVVVVGLGQRHVNEAENQNSDSQVARPSPQSVPIDPHHFASFGIGHRTLSAPRLSEADEGISHLRHYEPASRAGQAAPARRRPKLVRLAEISSVDIISRL
jgi:hypothetical protein